MRFRHKVDALSVTDGVVDGMAGEVLEPSPALRGQESSRTAAGSFELRAQAVIVTIGGIGGNHELVRRNWPERLGKAPGHMISGVPHHVDARMLRIAQDATGQRLPVPLFPASTRSGHSPTSCAPATSTRGSC